MARRLLLPAFSPKRVERLEPFTRELCEELLDAVAGKTEVDAAVDYAQHIPLRVIVRMLGFPQEDADIFRRFIRMVLEDVDRHGRGAPGTAEEGELDDLHGRPASPSTSPTRSDDLTSFLLDAEIDGNKLDPDHVARHDGPVDDRGHRHDVVRDRRVAVAPRAAPGRPGAPRRTSPN